MRLAWLLAAVLVASPALAEGFDPEQLAAELEQRARLDTLARARRLADREDWDELRACKAALDLALQHHIADEHTRACEAWLSRNYGAEWHVVDDLRPKIAPPFAAGPFAPTRP